MSRSTTKPRLAKSPGRRKNSWNLGPSPGESPGKEYLLGKLLLSEFFFIIVLQYIFLENIVGKGEIAHYEQFLLFLQCFPKTCPTGFRNVPYFFCQVGQLSHIGIILGRTLPMPYYVYKFIMNAEYVGHLCWSF